MGFKCDLFENETQAHHMNQQVVDSLAGPSEGWNATDGNPMERETSDGERMYESVEDLSETVAENIADAEAFGFAWKDFQFAEVEIYRRGFRGSEARQSLYDFLLADTGGSY